VAPGKISFFYSDTKVETVPESVLPHSEPLTFRKKIYRDLEELQVDLDEWLFLTTMSELIREKSAVVVNSWRRLRMTSKCGRI
jgi:hypothetical protein